MGISSAGKEAEQREVPLAAGGKAKWYDHFGKDSHVDGFGRTVEGLGQDMNG